MDDYCLMQFPVVVYEVTVIQVCLQYEDSCTVDTMHICMPYLGNDSFMQWVDPNSEPAVVSLRANRWVSDPRSHDDQCKI